MREREPLELCQAYNPDLQRVKALKALLPHEETFHDLAQLLKACADPTRLKILYALSKSELCVCELAHLTGLSMPTISYHLRLLHQAKLIRFRRQARLVFYRLRENGLNEFVRRLVEEVQGGV